MASITPNTVLVGVTNGHFVLRLDFGAIFPGAARCLQLGVRTNIGSFTTLLPRQQLTATPYAVHAANAGLAAGVPAGSINRAMLAPGAVYQLGTPGGGICNALSVLANLNVGIGTNHTEQLCRLPAAAFARMPLAPRSPGCSPTIRRA